MVPTFGHQIWIEIDLRIVTMQLKMVKRDPNGTQFGCKVKSQSWVIKFHPKAGFTPKTQG